MPTVRYDKEVRAHNTLPDIFRTLNGTNLDLGLLDRLHASDPPGGDHSRGPGPSGPAGLPRIILRDALGYELDTFTTLQEAIYRAKRRVKQTGQARTPLEWRLPKAPLPAKPDLTRTGPPDRRKIAPPATETVDVTPLRGIPSNVLEFDVDDVGFVRESLQYLPYVPSLSFLRQEILSGPKTYFQIVGTVLLHKKMLSQTEKRQAVYNFPGLCSGCMRIGLCYGCERSNEPHYHEDRPVKTGGGFTYFKKDRPENEIKAKNPVNWKIHHPDQALKKLMEEYAGVGLDGQIPDEIRKHLDEHGGHRIRNLPEVAPEQSVDIDDDANNRSRDVEQPDGDGQMTGFLPDIEAANGDREPSYRGQGYTSRISSRDRRGQHVDPSEVDVEMSEDATDRSQALESDDDEGGRGHGKGSKRYSRLTIPISRSTDWSRSRSRSGRSGGISDDDSPKRRSSEAYKHRLPRYKQTETDEDDTEVTEDEEGSGDRKRRRRGRHREKLYKAPPAFKLRRSPTRRVEAKSPFSTDRNYNIPKGDGFVVKKSNKRPTEFKDFRNVDASWKEPKKFELKKQDHKTTKFWSGPPKKKEKSRSRSPRLRRVPSPRAVSPDSGLDSEFMTAIVRRQTAARNESHRSKSPFKSPSSQLVATHRKQRRAFSLPPAVGLDSPPLEEDGRHLSHVTSTPTNQHDLDGYHDTAAELYKDSADTENAEEPLQDEHWNDSDVKAQISLSGINKCKRQSNDFRAQRGLSSRLSLRDSPYLSPSASGPRGHPSRGTASRKHEHRLLQGRDSMNSGSRQNTSKDSFNPQYSVYQPRSSAISPVAYDGDKLAYNNSDVTDGSDDEEWKKTAEKVRQLYDQELQYSSSDLNDDDQTIPQSRRKNFKLTKPRSEGNADKVDLGKNRHRSRGIRVTMTQKDVSNDYDEDEDEDDLDDHAVDERRKKVKRLYKEEVNDSDGSVKSRHRRHRDKKTDKYDTKTKDGRHRRDKSGDSGDQVSVKAHHKRHRGDTAGRHDTEIKDGRRRGCVGRSREKDVFNDDDDDLDDGVIDEKRKKVKRLYKEEANESDGSVKPRHRRHRDKKTDKYDTKTKDGRRRRDESGDSEERISVKAHHKRHRDETAGRHDTEVKDGRRRRRLGTNRDKDGHDSYNDKDDNQKKDKLMYDHEETNGREFVQSHIKHYKNRKTDKHGRGEKDRHKEIYMKIRDEKLNSHNPDDSDVVMDTENQKESSRFPPIAGNIRKRNAKNSHEFKAVNDTVKFPNILQRNNKQIPNPASKSFKNDTAGNTQIIFPPIEETNNVSALKVPTGRKDSFLVINQSEDSVTADSLSDSDTYQDYGEASIPVKTTNKNSRKFNGVKINEESSCKPRDDSDDMLGGETNLYQDLGDSEVDTDMEDDEHRHGTSETCEGNNETSQMNRALNIKNRAREYEILINHKDEKRHKLKPETKYEKYNDSVENMYEKQANRKYKARRNRYKNTDNNKDKHIEELSQSNFVNKQETAELKRNDKESYERSARPKHRQKLQRPKGDRDRDGSSNNRLNQSKSNSRERKKKRINSRTSSKTYTASSNRTYSRSRKSHRAGSEKTQDQYPNDRTKKPLQRRASVDSDMDIYHMDREGQETVMQTCMQKKRRLSQNEDEDDSETDVFAHSFDMSNEQSLKFHNDDERNYGRRYQEQNKQCNEVSGTDVSETECSHTSKQRHNSENTQTYLEDSDKALRNNAITRKRAKKLDKHLRAMKINVDYNVTLESQEVEFDVSENSDEQSKPKMEGFKQAHRYTPTNNDGDNAAENRYKSDSRNITQGRKSYSDRAYHESQLPDNKRRRRRRRRHRRDKNKLEESVEDSIRINAKEQYSISVCSDSPAPQESDDSVKRKSNFCIAQDENNSNNDSRSFFGIDDSSKNDSFERIKSRHTADADNEIGKRKSVQNQRYADRIHIQNSENTKDFETHSHGQYMPEDMTKSRKMKKIERERKSFASYRVVIPTNTLDQHPNYDDTRTESEKECKSNRMLKERTRKEANADNVVDRGRQRHTKQYSNFDNDSDSIQNNEDMYDYNMGHASSGRNVSEQRFETHSLGQYMPEDRMKNRKMKKAERGRKSYASYRDMLPKNTLDQHPNYDDTRTESENEFYSNLILKERRHEEANADSVVDRSRQKQTNQYSKLESDNDSIQNSEAMYDYNMGHASSGRYAPEQKIENAKSRNTTRYKKSRAFSKDMLTTDSSENENSFDVDESKEIRTNIDNSFQNNEGHNIRKKTNQESTDRKLTDTNKNTPNEKNLTNKYSEPKASQSKHYIDESSESEHGDTKTVDFIEQYDDDLPGMKLESARADDKESGKSNSAINDKRRESMTNPDDMVSNSNRSVHTAIPMPDSETYNQDKEKRKLKQFNKRRNIPIPAGNFPLTTKEHVGTVERRRLEPIFKHLTDSGYDDRYRNIIDDIPSKHTNVSKTESGTNQCHTEISDTDSENIVESENNTLGNKSFTYERDTPISNTESTHFNKEINSNEPNDNDREHNTAFSHGTIQWSRNKTKDKLLNDSLVSEDDYCLPANAYSDNADDDYSDGGSSVSDDKYEDTESEISSDDEKAEAMSLDDNENATERKYNHGGDQSNPRRMHGSPPVIPVGIDFEQVSLTSQEPDLELVFDDVINVENLEVVEEDKDEEERKRKEERRQRRQKHKRRKRRDEKRKEERMLEMEHAKGVKDENMGEENSSKVKSADDSLQMKESDEEIFDEAVRMIREESGVDPHCAMGGNDTEGEDGSLQEWNITDDENLHENQNDEDKGKKRALKRRAHLKERTGRSGNKSHGGRKHHSHNDRRGKGSAGFEHIEELDAEFPVETNDPNDENKIGHGDDNAERRQTAKRRNRSKEKFKRVGQNSRFSSPFSEYTSQERAGEGSDGDDEHQLKHANVEDRASQLGDGIDSDETKHVPSGEGKVKRRTRSKEKNAQPRRKRKTRSHESTLDVNNDGKTRMSRKDKDGKIANDKRDDDDDDDDELDFSALPSIQSQLSKILQSKPKTFVQDNSDDSDAKDESDKDKESDSDAEKEHENLKPEQKWQLMRPKSDEMYYIQNNTIMEAKKKRSSSLPILSEIENMLKNTDELDLDSLKAPLPVGAPVYLAAFPKSRVRKKQFKKDPKRVPSRENARGRSMSVCVVNNMIPWLPMVADSTNKSELEPLREETLTITPEPPEMERIVTPVREPTPASVNINQSDSKRHNFKRDSNQSNSRKHAIGGKGCQSNVGSRLNARITVEGDNVRDNVKTVVDKNVGDGFDRNRSYNNHGDESAEGKTHEKPRAVTPPKRKEIVKKEKKVRPKTPPPPPKPPTPKEPTPEPTPSPVEEPVSREISFDFIKDRSIPELPPIEIPDLPEFQEKESEYQGVKKERRVIEVTPELKEAKKKLPPPPKGAPRIRPRAVRRSKVAEAPVTTQELQQLSDPLDFLAKYCIINPDRLPYYERVFNGALSVQTPRYSREQNHGDLVHLPPAQLSKHEINMLHDLTVLTHTQTPRREGISGPEQYMEKLNYSIDFIHIKQEALQEDMQKLQGEKISYMAAQAKLWDRDIVRLDYKTRGKKKKKKKKKKKEEVDYDTYGVMTEKKTFHPTKASDITDEVIVSRMDDKMMKKVKKDPAVKKLTMEINRDIEKLKYFDQRVAEIEDEKDLVGLYCMDHYFTEQVDSSRPYEYRRQQSRLYQKLHPDPDIEMNIEEVEAALQQINNKLLTEKEFQYIYLILELPKREKINFRLFSIIAALSEKVTQMDPVIRKLINKVDYNALDVKMEKSKELFDLLQDPSVMPVGNAPAENLAVELTAGGLTPEHTSYVLSKFNREGKGFVDFLDFVTYVPLFIEIHNRIIKDPFNEALDV